MLRLEGYGLLTGVVGSYLPGVLSGWDGESKPGQALAIGGAPSCPADESPYPIQLGGGVVMGFAWLAQPYRWKSIAGFISRIFIS